jgi:hypothetical protein
MRDKWWNSLSPQMQQYLESQPLWHDRDLYTALAAGLIIGFVLGYITRI